MAVRWGDMSTEDDDEGAPPPAAPASAKREFAKAMRPKRQAASPAPPLAGACARAGACVRGPNAWRAAPLWRGTHARAVTCGAGGGGGVGGGGGGGGGVAGARGGGRAGPARGAAKDDGRGGGAVGAGRGGAVSRRSPHSPPPPARVGARSGARVSPAALCCGGAAVCVVRDPTVDVVHVHHARTRCG